MSEIDNELPIGAPSSFDAYEEAYLSYLEEEHLLEVRKPAISAQELFKRPALPVTSYVPGFVYAGSMNLVAGEPKAGKSTLVLYLTNAISNGEKFLGVESRKTNVLYVTEQNEASFRQEADTVKGFSSNPNLFILLPENSPYGNWTEHIRFWGEKLTATDSSILVIDTFGSFANLPPGGENDSACIAERLMGLKQLYRGRPSLAIILVHHIRKPSNDPRFPMKDFADLRDSRGSTAIVGGVDHCLMVSKASEHPSVRNVHTEGRFEREEKFKIMLTPDGYTEYLPFSASRRS